MNRGLEHRPWAGDGQVPGLATAEGMDRRRRKRKSDGVRRQHRLATIADDWLQVRSREPIASQKEFECLYRALRLRLLPTSGFSSDLVLLRHSSPVRCSPHRWSSPRHCYRRPYSHRARSSLGRARTASRKRTSAGHDRPHQAHSPVPAAQHRVSTRARDSAPGAAWALY
jgi:hypothetical protein